MKVMHAVQHAQQSRFATATFAYQRQELARVGFKAHIVQHFEADGFVEVLANGLGAENDGLVLHVTFGIWLPDRPAQPYALANNPHQW